MISNCGHDENNRYRNGKAGDQTKGEYCIRSWYNRPWDVVLRYPDESVANHISWVATMAANNSHIGYDQYQRLTYYNALRAADWNPERIVADVETDCSASTMAAIIASGVSCHKPALASLSPALTTFNMRAALRRAGFRELTDAQYRTSDKYLRPGDILLNELHHVAVNVTYGTLYQPSIVFIDAAKLFDKKVAGTYTVLVGSLNLRSGAGCDKNILKTLKKGDTVTCYGYYTFESVNHPWYYVSASGFTGYVCVYGDNGKPYIG